MQPTNNALQAPLILATIALAIWLLNWMQPVLVPIALAILLTFVLSPVITRLERLGSPRVPAVILVVVLASAIIGSIGWLVARQVSDLVESFPQYEQNLSAKIESLRSEEGGFVDRIQRIAEKITRDLEKSDAAAVDITRVGQGSEPLPVKVVTDASPFQLSELWSAFGPVVQPLSIVGFAVVLVIFMLIRREDLRDRVLSLVGRGRLTLTTKALDEAGERVSRYLLMQLVVNASYGAAVSAGLFLIGVPYAALWGFFAAVLRYIPYLGPWLAALFPLALSILVTDSWSPPLTVLGLFLVLELISNMVVEPWLYGRGIGISETATLVMIAFWTWLWGPIGLLLATPLTVCLAVFGKYVPALEFFDTLLGDRPALDSAMGYYQRLVARDQDEASDIAEDHLAEHTLVDTYDQLLIPALASAKHELLSAALSGEDHRHLIDATKEIAEELLTLSAESKTSAQEEAANGAPERARAGKVRVLAIAARDESDQAALTMLAGVVDEQAFDLRLGSATSLVSDAIGQVGALEPAIVCVAALPPGGGAQARLLCLRLRARYPELVIIVGRWGWQGDVERLRSQLQSAGANEIGLSLAETCRQLASLRSQGLAE